MKALGYIGALAIAAVIVFAAQNAKRSQKVANEQHNQEVFREAQRLNEEMKRSDAEREQQKKAAEEQEQMRRWAELKFDPVTGELIPPKKSAPRVK